MPKVVPILSDVAVRNLIIPGTYSVGGVTGLKLQVRHISSRSWILRATVAGKVRDIGMGSYPTIGLKVARDMSRVLHAQILQGLDPILTRQLEKDATVAARINRKTFDECAAAYISSVEKKWNNAKTPKQWQSTIATYASPVIGHLPVADVTTEHVLQILESIWITKTETASRLRGRLELILAYSTTRKYRSGENPARLKGHLDTLLPQASLVKVVAHHPALDYQDIGRFLSTLRRSKSMSARALEFVILTGTRSGEVRGATWGEIDMGSQLWTIPANRMKSKKAHIVPLSAQAIALLTALPMFVGSTHVFPGTRGGAMSDMTLSKLVKTLHNSAVGRGGAGFSDANLDDRVVTPHGFRSTFRDWAAEQTTFAREVIEHALAHQLKDKAEAAYQRRTSVPKRKVLMQTWADYIDESRSGSLDNILRLDVR
ncbi:MAG: integrase [Candidatus Azotimanducaceae bacterium]|jgi:integrase